ncbi:MAG: DUF308 domain-containing protein, partial [Clostridia bacterium]
MKRFFSGIGFLVLCVLEILIGVIIVFNPVSFAKVVLMLVGAGLMIGGIVNIFIYFRSDPFVGAMGMRLFQGIIFLALGLLFVFNPQKILDLIPMLSVFFGI